MNCRKPVPVNARRACRLANGGLALLLFLPACGGTRSDVGSASDLRERFAIVPDGAAGEKISQSLFDRHFPVSRSGRRLDSMVLLAPVTVAVPLTGSSGDWVLECIATPVFNIGDGFQMDVILRSGAGERTVFRRYFDAGRRAEDRNWIRLAVPFTIAWEKNPELAIRVSSGVQGDLVADWLALSELRLVQRTVSR